MNFTKTRNVQHSNASILAKLKSLFYADSIYTNVDCYNYTNINVFHDLLTAVLFWQPRKHIIKTEFFTSNPLGTGLGPDSG